MIWLLSRRHCRYSRHVRATILIGPAGSGKTFRCLAEVRAEVKRSAKGLPLFFLAPKQATFQIERELLSDPEIHGYTRLQVVSFERLARSVLDEASSHQKWFDLVQDAILVDGSHQIQEIPTSDWKPCVTTFRPS